MFADAIDIFRVLSDPPSLIASSSPQRNRSVDEKGSAPPLCEYDHQDHLGTELTRGGIVAAPCGATLGLASRGLLNDRRHTSNAPGFLAAIAAYRGNELYEDAPATADRNVITAGSAGSLLWAKLILEGLELYGKDVTDAWFDYFRTADPAHFARMTRALGAE